MIAATLLTLCAMLGQTPLYGDIPEDVPTFVITFPDGTVARGALLVDNAWHMEQTVVLSPGKAATIVYDTPWSPRQERVVRQPQYDFETLSVRKDRLTREWAAAGFTPVRTAQGERYVLAEEAQLAERSQEMAATLEDAQNAAPVEETSTEPAPSPVPPWQRWGPHAGIALAGLALSAFIAKRFLLQ